MPDEHTQYHRFLQTKMAYAASEGLTAWTLPDRLFPFQRQVTSWAIERGRAALFLDTGLGKSACQLAWAHNIAAQKGDVLILAPLAVAQQTVREGCHHGHSCHALSHGRRYATWHQYHQL